MKHEARAKRIEHVLKVWDKHYPNISVSEVAKLTGLGERVIYDYLKEAGRSLPPKRYRKVDTEQVRLAHQLYAEHGSMAKVGRIMDISRQLVKYYLKKDLKKVKGEI